MTSVQPLPLQPPLATSSSHQLTNQSRHRITFSLIWLKELQQQAEIVAKKRFSLLSLSLLTRPRQPKVATTRICCCRQTHSALTFSVNLILCAPGSERAGERAPRSASRHKEPIDASSSFPLHVPFGASGSASVTIKNRHNSCGSKTLYHKRNFEKGQ